MQHGYFVESNIAVWGGFTNKVRSGSRRKVRKPASNT